MKDLLRWKQITAPETKKAALDVLGKALFMNENLAVIRAARRIGTDRWDGKNKKELGEFNRQFSPDSEKLPSWKKLDSADYSLWLDKKTGIVMVAVEMEYKLWERADTLRTYETCGVVEIKMSALPGAESLFLSRQTTGTKQELAAVYPPF